MVFVRHHDYIERILAEHGVKDEATEEQSPPRSARQVNAIIKSLQESRANENA